MPPYPRYSRYSATMEILSFPFLFARKVSHAFQACALILLMCLIKQKFTEQAQTTCLPSAHINSIPQRTKLLYSIQIFHRFLLHVIQWGESLLPFFLRSSIPLVWFLVVMFEDICLPCYQNNSSFTRWNTELLRNFCDQNRNHFVMQ